MDKSPASSEKCPTCPIAVIVRAFADEPVKLTAHQISASHALVAGADPRKAIGFPIVAVFEFQEQLFRDLTAAYGRGDPRALETLWGQARPIREESLN